MAGTLIRLTLAAIAPPPQASWEDASSLTRFGRWLRDECRRQVPGTALQRFRLHHDEVVLLLELCTPDPPLVAALAFCRRFRTTTTAAAQRHGWLGPDAPLWGAQQLMVVEPPIVRSGRASAGPGRAAGRVRSLTTPRVRAR